MSDLPGQDVVERGLVDHASGIESEESLLVEIAASRLRDLGHTDAPAPPGPDAELRLYRRLRRTHPADAYSRYNALLRRLSRYVRAAESRAARAPRQEEPEGEV
ncbi:MAG: hypothetical protein ACF8XB_07160 [Planctomycetota bacterium JB042]